MSRTPTWLVFRDGEWGPATAQDAAADAERIRKLADSFDPMGDVYWTLGQALAWIIYHDVDRVRECSEAWRQKGVVYVEGAPLRPFRPIWREISKETSDAWAELYRELRSGTVTTTGLDAADGKPRVIDPLELMYLGFGSIGQAEPQLYRTDDIDKTAPSFREVRVRVADVLRIWRRPERQGHAADRTRGRRPIKSPKIEAAMRSTDPETLRAMTEEAMAATYGAARSTCREVRKKVLAN